MIEPAEREASWLDDQCHRSLYSHQNLASMWLASLDPHRVITIVHVSCSGAEIVDGLLAPQSDPPGGGRVGESQLHAATRMLQQIRQSNGFVPDRKAPLLVMLSIGGNDAGFSRYAVHLIAPYEARLKVFNPFFQAFRKSFGKPLTEDDVHDRILHDLPGSYHKLATALSAAVSDAWDPEVVITEYPYPIFRENGEPCGQAIKSDCNEATCRVSMFELFRARVPKFGKLFGEWQFQINGGQPLSEHDVTIHKVIDPLNAAVRASAEKYGWHVAKSFQNVVQPHGMCAVEHPADSAAELGWTYPIQDHGWSRADPAVWNPYSQQARWFRTAHDAVLTQFKNDNIGVMNGMLHPSAREHAAVAQSIVTTFER